MVFFVCTSCQETVKKQKVDAHCQKCRSCWVLVCVDCNKEFEGDAFRAHTSCISEAEKYQGALFRGDGKKKGKMSPQDAWMERVHAAAASSETPADVRDALKQMAGHANIPRKKTKFLSFCRNSTGVRAQPMVERVFDIVSATRIPYDDEKEAAAAEVEAKKAAKAAQEAAAGAGAAGATKRDRDSDSSDSDSDPDSDGDGHDAAAKAARAKEAAAAAKAAASVAEASAKAKKEAKKAKKEAKKAKKAAKDAGDKPAKRARAASDASATPAGGDADTPTGEGGGASSTDAEGKFKWSREIKAALKAAPGNKLKAKRLRKQVVANALRAMGSGADEAALGSKYDAKIAKMGDKLVYPEGGKFVVLKC